MGHGRNRTKSVKIRQSRCDANSTKKHVMKVHDGMIQTGNYLRLNGCHRKELDVN